VILKPEQVAAYRFAPDGTVHNIMDEEVNLIIETPLFEFAVYEVTLSSFILPPSSLLDNVPCQKN